MPGRLKLGLNVFDMALKRMVEEYDAGHRIIVAVSGGKDSGACLELAVMAATMAGRLPVEAVTRDEEIAWPGTYEYLERMHERDDVDLTWLVANQPITNAFDRADPYWWVFDPLVDPELWVRQPPPYAVFAPELDIQDMVNLRRYPVADGQELRAVVGLRVSESSGRLMGLHSQGGYITAVTREGCRNITPIYDWKDGDIWLAHKKFGWDYSSAYDVMNRYDIKMRDLRIGPPTMNGAGGEALRLFGQYAWPDWWNRVCRRLPSIRTFAKYGKVAIEPQRRLGESWEECFQRECIDTAPDWIAARSEAVRNKVVGMHLRHAAGKPLPQVSGCHGCGLMASWRDLVKTMYLGDPFSKSCGLPCVEPEFFRPGAGFYDKKPTFGPEWQTRQQVNA